MSTLRFHTIGLLVILSIAVGFFLVSESAHAAIKTWDGGAGGDTNMSTAANWDADTLPTAGDTLTFDGTSGNNATWDSGFVSATNWQVNMATGYTGTITLTSSTLTIASTTVVAGTFSVGSNTLDVTGETTINGGVVTSTTDGGTMDFDGDVNLLSGTFHPAQTVTAAANWVVSGGTLVNYTAHDWTLTFDSTSTNQSVTAGGASVSYYNVKINNTEGASSDVVTISDAFTAVGYVTVQDGKLSTGGAIDLTGDLTISQNAQAEWEHTSGTTNFEGSIFESRSGAITISTPNPMTLDGSSTQFVSSTASFPGFVINKTGTAQFGSAVGDMTTSTFGNYFNLTSGNADFATNNIGVDIGSFISIGASAGTLSWGTRAFYVETDTTINGGTITPGTGQFILDKETSATQTITLNAAASLGSMRAYLFPFARTIDINGSYGLTLTDLAIDTGMTVDIDGASTTISSSISNDGTLTEGTGYVLKANDSTIITDSGGTEQNSIAYVDGTLLYFSVTDEDENTDGATADTMSVTVSTPDGDSESVTLTETGTATEVFTGSIQIANTGTISPSNSKLELNGEVTVTLSYTDAQDATDTGTDTAVLSGPSVAGRTIIKPKYAQILINNDAFTTTEREVVLSLDADDVVEMLVSEDSTFSGLTWQAFTDRIPFTLSDGFGTKTLYARFANTSGNLSEVVSASIEYIDTDAPTQPDGTVSSPEGDVVPDAGEEMVLDTDNDGLADEAEVAMWKTDPTNPDTDGDGYNDGLEVRSGYSPTGPGKLADVLDTPGSVVKNVSTFAVYYIGRDGKRHAFPNEQIYRTWFDSFVGVHTVRDRDLAKVPLGKNMKVRPSTRLIKITTDPKVYAVGTGGTIHWVVDEFLATDLYGTDWAKQVIDVSDALFPDYMRGADIGTYWYPNGTIVRQAGEIFFVENMIWRRFRDTHAIEHNVVNAPLIKQAPGGTTGVGGLVIDEREDHIVFPTGFSAQN